MNALVVLKAVWPSGIPVNDYEKAVRVVNASAGAQSPVQQVPREKRLDSSPEAKAKRRDEWLARSIVSDAKLSIVRTLLAIGPQSYRDCAIAASLSVPSATWCVRKLGCVKAGKKAPTAGNRQSETLWALPAVMP